MFKTLINDLKTPCFVVDRPLLRKNLEVLELVKKESGAKVLLALKGFAMFSTFDLVREYLDGTCASSPHEARLGSEEFGKEVHAFAAAYSNDDMEEIQKYAKHIVFNSVSQFNYFVKSFPDLKEKSLGLRINPEHSETEYEIYDPCAKHSRLGIPVSEFPETLPPEIEGLHMHTLCQQNADALYRTLHAAEKNFGHFFKQIQWLNLGGGHHITRNDYDLKLLIKTIQDIKSKYELDIYLEPGEAVALNTGFLVATVLDIIHNEMDIAILDTSAAAHMPDVIEMPYRPDVVGSTKAFEKKYTYRFAGLSCLAGDVIGDYSFDKKLKTGDKVIFTDMAHYTMVKTNTFNGINLPALYYIDSDIDQIINKKEFGYIDFKQRLS